MLFFGFYFISANREGHKGDKERSVVALYIRGSALLLFPFKSTIFSRLGRQSARLGLWEGGKSQRPTVGQIRDVKAYNVYGQMNV